MSTTIAPEPRPAKKHLRRYAETVCRIVEGHRRISTRRLAETPADQAILDKLIGEVEPVLPVSARGLDPLLSGSFRYAHKRESRFRRAGERPGIFYASEDASTAVAEAAYWRLVFHSRSPGAALPRGNIEYSGFTVGIATDRALDLTKPPLAAASDLWTRPDDYAPCQRLAAEARKIEAQLIRYSSVRDPAGKANLALFDPAAFAGAEPQIQGTWHFRFEGTRLMVFAAFPSGEAYNFTFSDYGLPAPA